MDEKLLMPVIGGAFILLVIGRRILRNIGRQPLQPGRMQFRIALFAVIGVLFAVRALHDVSLFGALLGGIAGGAALGWLGLRHTRFERTEQGAFYTPHTWIGLAVSMLLIARLAYRFAIVMPAMQAAARSNQDVFGAYQRSPLTLALFGVVIGYYVCYYTGLLRIARRGDVAPAA